MTVSSCTALNHLVPMRGKMIVNLDIQEALHLVRNFALNCLESLIVLLKEERYRYPLDPNKTCSVFWKNKVTRSKI